jgi:hypothetical protein
MPAVSVFSQGGGKDQIYSGSFRAELVKLTWPGMADPERNGALVQQVQFQIQRTVNMLYEIGSPNVYYVGGRRQGNATFTRVVSGSKTFRQLALDYGDICAPKDLWLDAAQSACTPPELAAGGGGVVGGGVKYTMMGATLNMVGASVTAQDVVINETLGFMFVDLGYEEAGGGGA